MRHSARHAARRADEGCHEGIYLGAAPPPRCPAARHQSLLAPLGAEERSCGKLYKEVAEWRRVGVTYDELEARSGVLRTTAKAWRINNKPSMDTLDAALGALGWSLLPVPSPCSLPAALRHDLEVVASKHGLAEVPALQLIAACSDYGWRLNLEAREARS